MSQVWKEGASGEPKFPDKFDVVKKAVLQVTDIKTNRNKYYAVELHSAKTKFRVYTHYGRTDDLDTNPNAGMRESRYCNSLTEAEDVYNKIYSEKTSARKGYKEINLASSKIGSKVTIGKSCGEIDDKTLKKLAGKTPAKKDAGPKVTLSTAVQDFVSYIYSEATKALVTTVNVSITANGIETPLGVLTLGQIDKGQAFLDELNSLLSKKKTQSIQDKIVELSGEFYTVVPHRFGRSKEAANEAVINTIVKLSERQDTLQLMRDMLNVNSKGSNVLLNPKIEKKYTALGCNVEEVSKSSPEFKKIRDYIVKSQDYKQIAQGDVKNLYTLRRDGEHKVFDEGVGNVKLLFHGSNVKNWVGILSRGLLMPKTVVKLGVHRTDAGWLGNGIYFGDAVDTSLSYAGAGKRGTSFVALADVALGKIKQYRKIAYGLSSPPDGFDSCHGVKGSDFSDDEFVIYNEKQQRLKYLVEIDD